MKKASFLVGVALLALLAAATAAIAANIVYDVIPLENFWAGDINNRGQIAGRTPDGHAAIWYRGQMNLVDIDADWSGAMGVNDGGTVLISAAWDKPKRMGFYLVHQDGLIQKVDIPFGDAVHGLNNTNQVVGETYDPLASPHIQSGFIWDNCRMALLTQEGMCTMVGINNPGQATGFLWGSGDGDRPFIWNGSQIVMLQMPAWNEGRPFGINDGGLIAGYYHSLDGWGDWYPVLWKPDGQMIQLSQLHGQASDINNRGDILGWVEPPGKLYQVALWRLDGSSIFLEEHLRQPLRILYSPLSMNNRGEIVCSGIRPNGTSGYFLLQPRHHNR